MAAGYVPSAALNSLYSNTTPGTVADPSAIDGAVQAIAQTINENYDAAQVINSGLSGHKDAVVLDHPDQSVTTVKLKDANVTAAKLADGSVTTAKIAAGSVTTDKLADISVTAAKLADGAISTVKINDAAVTTAKIALGAITSDRIQSGAVGGAQLDPTLFQNLSDIEVQARFEQVDAQLAEITQLKPAQESAALGAELVGGSGWTTTGWTGDFATGFIHTSGQTTSLTYPLSTVAGRLYQVSFTVDDTDTANSGFKFTVTVGNSAPFQLYKGTGATINYSLGIKAVSAGDLSFNPETDFTGTIKNISVKEITGTIESNDKILDSDENVVFEIRPTEESLDNIFIGKDAGKRVTSGYENTIIGSYAMPNNTSGFWNSAVGKDALSSNTVGSRNVAIGFNSLRENISGHRNIAVGTFALNRITTGAYNIGIGADSAWHTTTGQWNIAIGTVSLDANTTGSGNIAIGYNALRDNLDTSYNVGIGHWALRQNTAHNNTAVGSRAASQTVAAGGITAIGYEALEVSTGANNTAVGQSAATALASGSGNTAIGRTSLFSLTTGSSNTTVGYDSVRNLVDGSRNVAVGQDTGSTLTNGENNILIGAGTDVPTATTSNHLNIGKLIYGDLSTLRIGISVSAPLAKLHIGAGTTTVAPIRINSSSGVLLTTPMNGCFEYDGTNLYFTVGTTRKTVTLT